mmetsp:Transcript_84791/g.149690  ORF Transcript_84791/g.149690 Transcript_84791/m.149690 type:complete len:92 (+) Transcript_84791:1042-1317(+)
MCTWFSTARKHYTWCTSFSRARKHGWLTDMFGVLLFPLEQTGVPQRAELQSAENACELQRAEHASGLQRSERRSVGKVEAGSSRKVASSVL